MEDDVPSSNESGIPTIFISVEEMAAFESAISNAARSLAARSLSSLPQKTPLLPKQSPSSLPSSPKSIVLTTTHHGRIDPKPVDVEDSGGYNRSKLPKSLFQRYRMKRGLSVTDITSAEWCEKQMEFVLTRGRPESTEAMRNGSSRHLQLEEEVIKRVEVRPESREDVWAMKLLNFIHGTNLLLSKGLTRELPIVGLVEGVWMVGVIDEVRLTSSTTPTADVQKPMLVDTKTRLQKTLPSEAQTRNGRLQMMCYKYLWDYTVSNDFPTSYFFKFFGLNPWRILSKEIRDHIANSGFHVETLDELMNHYIALSRILPPSRDELLLRYELQEDHSLLGEHNFTFDPSWFRSQMQFFMDFWLGRREAGYVSKDDRWKCRHCSFSSACPRTRIQSDAK